MGYEDKFKAVQLEKPSEYPGILWALEYKDSQNDFQFNPNETLTIIIENLTVYQRPSLRYLDVHYRDAISNKSLALVQHSILLKRPANYVSPPFPLITYWLDNHNTVYISSQKKGIHLPLKLKMNLDFRSVISVYIL